MPLVRVKADVVMTTGIRVAQQHPGVIELGHRWLSFYPPIDTTRFHSVSEAGAPVARAELGIEPGVKVVGNVSNINPQKGHATFIRAAAELRKLRPDVQFVILGATYPQHAGYTRSLWTLAESLGLKVGRDLLVRDPGSRVAELAAAFNVFWLTSEPLSEGIPTVLEEAMALETPV